MAKRFLNQNFSNKTCYCKCFIELRWVFSRNYNFVLNQQIEQLIKLILCYHVPTSFLISPTC